MIYIVSKRKGVWTGGASGVLMNFDDYCSAVDIARGAARVLERVSRKYDQAGIRRSSTEDLDDESAYLCDFADRSFKASTGQAIKA